MIAELTSAKVDRDVRAGLELAVRFLHEDIAALRAAGVAVGEDDYRGLYISDSEADRLLGGARLPSSHPPRAGSVALRGELAALAAGCSGRLSRLAALGPLGPFEVGVLLLCLASEVDASVERLLAYAQDDVTRRRPRVDLLLRLFGEGGYEERDALLPRAALIRLGLVALLDEPGQPATPLGARYVSLDPRVAEYLLGSDALCHPMAGSAAIEPPDENLSLLLAHDLRLALRGVATAPDESRPRTVALCGPDRALLRGAASAIASGWNRPLLVVNVPALVAEAGLSSAVTLALREAVMQDALPLLEQVDQLEPGDRARLAAELEGQALVPLAAVGLAVEAGWPGFRIDVEELDFDRRSALWRQAVPGADGAEERSIDSVAAKFRLGVDGIRRAGEQAAVAARWRDPSAAAPSTDDLHASARSQSAPILSGLARKIVPHYHWDDLVLPGDALEQLREISARVEHRHRVYEAWGFERKLSLSRGVIALLAGNSGTGKTMAAEVMANALGLDLYRIDLSAVVSKYIGETEKNLDAIFREAERSNAVLFFDEADALFGKRSEVKDAHDRYANIETAYLLQRMEEYSGIVILATNLKMNLDEAFVRRLHFVVDFPMPDESFRQRIWQGAVPPEAPVSGDIDWEFLARQFKVSGGNIKNAVVAGAFLAAGEGQAIGMSHLIRGMRREYQKLGRMVTDIEFGPYVTYLQT